VCIFRPPHTHALGLRPRATFPSLALREGGLGGGAELPGSEYDTEDERLFGPE